MPPMILLTLPAPLSPPPPLAPPRQSSSVEESGRERVERGRIVMPCSFLAPRTCWRPPCTRRTTAACARKRCRGRQGSTSPLPGGTGPRLAPAEVRVACCISSSGLLLPQTMPRSLSQPRHCHSAAIIAATAASAAGICEIQDLPSSSSGGGSESVEEESESDLGSIGATSATGGLGMSRRTDATAAVAAAAAAVHRETGRRRSLKGRQYDVDILRLKATKGDTKKAGRASAHLEVQSVIQAVMTAGNLLGRLVVSAWS